MIYFLKFFFTIFMFINQYFASERIKNIYFLCQINCDDRKQKKKLVNKIGTKSKSLKGFDVKKTFKVCLNEKNQILKMYIFYA